MAVTPKKTSLRARRFGILANENRIRLIEALLIGPRNVSSLVTELGIEQSLLSHHLAALRAEGIATCERDGKSLIYRLSDDVRAGMPPHQINLKCCKITLTRAPRKSSTDR